jgi:hypothetical protein
MVLFCARLRGRISIAVAARVDNQPRQKQARKKGKTTRSESYLHYYFLRVLLCFVITILVSSRLHLLFQVSSTNFFFFLFWFLVKFVL